MRPIMRLRRAERRRGSGMLIRLPATRCLTLFLHFVIAVKIGPNRAGTWIRQEVACQQSLAQLLQTLLTEVSHAKQVFLVHRKHLTNFRNVTALEAVIRANREIKLLDGSIVDLLWNRYAAQRRLLRLGQSRAVVGKLRKMAYQNIGTLAQGLIRWNCAVGPDFKNNFIVVCHLSYARMLNGIIYLLHRRVNGIYRDHPDGLVFF